MRDLEDQVNTLSIQLERAIRSEGVAASLKESNERRTQTDEISLLLTATRRKLGLLRVGQVTKEPGISLP